jgi:hypothetical protein
MSGGRGRMSGVFGKLLLGLAGLFLAGVSLAEVFHRRASHLRFGSEQPIFQLVEPFERFTVVQLERRELLLPAFLGQSTQPRAEVEHA